MSERLINRIVLRSGVAAALNKVILPPDGLKFPPPGPPPGTISIVQGPGLVGFKLNGTLRWLIDVRRFSGTPVVRQPGFSE